MVCNESRGLRNESNNSNAPEGRLSPAHRAGSGDGARACGTSVPAPGLAAAAGSLCSRRRVGEEEEEEEEESVAHAGKAVGQDPALAPCFCAATGRQHRPSFVIAEPSVPHGRANLGRVKAQPRLDTKDRQFSVAKTS